ncbi:hypothetical protein MODO_3116 [Myroides odoratimimus]|uniref:SGNH/GDSL hydrolase family protein n=1 Tax=Myroides odoratimimus TaxID=76832 RepID=UPI00072A0D65|nr:SGNH/GDSL hydrolase family protein [Myroides odoratimimus]GAQ15420.1 hypothetical protein MODO_3116 [Myroides odoratimimus]STZ48119.1 Uncharacterised protein [Myroides odoratimimus]
MIQPLKINKKVDNDAKLAQIIKENIPAYEYMSADEVNSMVGKINEMVPAINVSNGGFQGTLSVNEKRVDSGFYIPTESGIFINADNIQVDLSQGINFVTYDGDKWEVAVVPIVADGQIEEGNMGFVSGGEVYSKGFLNEEDQDFSSLGRNKFDYKKVKKGFYLADDKIIRRENAIISHIIDLSDNPTKTIAVSGLALKSRWSFHYQFLNKNDEVIEFGYISESLTKLTIPYNSKEIVGYRMTVFSDKAEENESLNTIMIEFGSVFHEFEEYQRVVKTLFRTPIESTYATKCKDVAEKNTDIINLLYLENSKKTIKFLDKEKTFEQNFNTVYHTDSLLGFIRSGFFGKINSLSCYLCVGDNTEEEFEMKIGYTHEFKNGIKEEEVVILTSKKLYKKDYKKNTFDLLTFNFNEVTIPFNKNLIVFFTTPIKLPLFNLTNSDFDENDYKLLYKTKGSSQFGYGYAYSTGIEVSYSSSLFFSKKVVFIADSITAHTNSWAYQAARKLKFDLVNLSISGARYQDFTNTTFDFSSQLDSNSPNNTVFNQVCRLAQKITPKGEQIKWAHPITKNEFNVPIDIAVGSGELERVDLIVLAAGTNDSKYNTENAYLEYVKYDYPNYDRKVHMVTGLMWAIESIKCIAPNVQIIISTPIQSNPTGSRRFEITKQKRDRIVEVANYYGITVIDSFFESGISEKFETNDGENGKYLYDGLHPNDQGKKLMGNFLVKKIRTEINIE